MKRAETFIGEKFHKLVVAEIDGAKATCICECGNKKIVDIYLLRRGNNKSCGCLAKMARRKAIDATLIHGMSKTVEYKTWVGMRKRCTNTKDKNYKNYGGRGIFVCQEWDMFEKFFEDMGIRPKGASIERVDNSGPYSKENCIWANATHQCRNKRNSIKVEFDGEKISIKELSEKVGISYELLYQRIIVKKWAVCDAASRKKYNHKAAQK